MPYRNKDNGNTVEAFQMVRVQRYPTDAWPEWLHQAWAKPSNADGALFSSGVPDAYGAAPLLLVSDGESEEVTFDSYIIRDDAGVVSLLVPAQFEKSYEEI